MEGTERARGAISGPIINVNQPSNNTSLSVTLDNEFLAAGSRRPRGEVGLLLFLKVFIALSSHIRVFAFVSEVCEYLGESILPSQTVEVQKTYFYFLKKCQRGVEMRSSVKICFVFSRWLIKIKGISLGFRFLLLFTLSSPLSLQTSSSPKPSAVSPHLSPDTETQARLNSTTMQS